MKFADRMMSAPSVAELDMNTITVLLPARRRSVRRAAVVAQHAEQNRVRGSNSIYLER